MKHINRIFQGMRTVIQQPAGFLIGSFSARPALVGQRFSSSSTELLDGQLMNHSKKAVVRRTDLQAQITQASQDMIDLHYSGQTLPNGGELEDLHRQLAKTEGEIIALRIKELNDEIKELDDEIKEWKSVDLNQLSSTVIKQYITENIKQAAEKKQGLEDFRNQKGLHQTQVDLWKYMVKTFGPGHFASETAFNTMKATEATIDSLLGTSHP